MDMDDFEEQVDVTAPVRKAVEYIVTIDGACALVSAVNGP
jgi:hypothetical protein